MRLIEGLTKASIGVVRALSKFGRQAGEISVSRSLKRGHGQSGKIDYSIILHDNFDQHERSRFGKDVPIGEISIYVEDIVYVIQHDEGRKIRSIAKYDIEEKEEGEPKNNDFGQEDIEILNKLIPSFAKIKADKRVSVRSPWIYGAYGAGG